MKNQGFPASELRQGGLDFLPVVWTGGNTLPHEL
jgi:hypothetical protein